jgi:hypothetical protein
MIGVPGQPDKRQSPERENPEAYPGRRAPGLLVWETYGACGLWAASDSRGR